MPQVAAKIDQAAVEAADSALTAMNEPFYEAWRRGEFATFRDGLLDYCTPAMRATVVICRMLAQVYNGGWMQWATNGYAESGDLLIRALEQVGTDAAKIVAAQAHKAMTSWEELKELKDAYRHDRLSFGELELAEESLWAWADEAEEQMYGVGDFAPVGDQLLLDLLAWVQTRR